jgi:hypothetical protein
MAVPKDKGNPLAKGLIFLFHLPILGREDGNKGLHLDSFDVLRAF